MGEHEGELIAFRRDLHAHPEIGYGEHRTTEVLLARLRDFGLQPSRLPGGTGVVCDLGSGPRTVALRADIDALPIEDGLDTPYRSQHAGVSHACGHDVHTAALLGTAGALMAAGPFDGRVRLLFQPAEELMPGGAEEVVRIGLLDDVHSVFALHCDPRLSTGRIGLRPGAITAACDLLEVHLRGPGGHTARPHLTADLVYALGKVIVDLPGLLSRRIDSRAGLSLVWGTATAGVAANAIPEAATAKATVRMLDRDVWDDAERVIRELVQSTVAPTGAEVSVEYVRGVPPVVNDPAAVEVQRRAVLATLGPDGVAGTEQSMGGEDFGWMVAERPGALARLGVRDPQDTGPLHDLHQGTFDADERAVAIGARFLAQTALVALEI
ncbi:MAG: amidohydrolase [bacterium]